MKSAKTRTKLRLWRTGKLITGTMTLTLNLPPEVEHSFLAEAHARGVSPNQLVSDILLARRPLPAISAGELSPEEWVRKFETWTTSQAGRNLPILSDDNISRESIYAERGL